MVFLASSLNRLKEAEPLAARLDFNDKGTALMTATVYYLDPDSLRLVPALREIPADGGRSGMARDLVDQLTVAAPEGQAALPEGTRLLHFFETDQGTAVLDFNAEIADVAGTGILGERLRLDALTRTLCDNLHGIDRVQLLVYGQPMTRWGNHLDLEATLETAP